MRFGKPHLWLFLSTLIWSGSTIFAKVSVQSGPPMHMAALRFTFGALILLPTLALSAWPRSLTRTDWCEIGLMGILGIFFYNICFRFSLLHERGGERPDHVRLAGRPASPPCPCPPGAPWPIWSSPRPSSGGCSGSPD